MYGINLLEVGRILGTSFASNVLFHQHGVVKSIHAEIIKYSAEQNIAMVKVMMRSLAEQNKKAYDEMVAILEEQFSEEELQEIVGSRS